MKQWLALLWIGSVCSVGLFCFVVCKLEVEKSVSRFLQNHASVTSSLRDRLHQAKALHLVNLQIGTPAQEQTLVVSTTIDDTHLACHLPCTNCNGKNKNDNNDNVDSTYDLQASSTSSLRICPDGCLSQSAVCLDGGGDTNACHHIVVQDAHGELAGGYKGYEVTDQIEVQSRTFMADFTCQYQQTGNDNNGYRHNGYLSMSTAPTSFLEQLYSHRIIRNKVFSLCFWDESATTEIVTEGATAGHVTLGGYDAGAMSTPLVWALNAAPTLSLSGYYVNIRRILLGVGGDDNKLKAAAMGTMSMVPIDKTPLMQSIDRIMRGQQGRGQQTSTVKYTHVNGTIGSVIIHTMQAETVLHASLQVAFVTAFQVLAGRDFNLDGMPSVTRDTVRYMPTIFLQLEAHRDNQGDFVASEFPGLAGRHDSDHPYDVLLAIPPQHYFTFDDKGLAIPSILFSSHGSSIGANALQGYEIVFDAPHHRIGLALRQDCPEGVSLATGTTPVLHAKNSVAATQSKTHDDSTSNIADNTIVRTDSAAVGPDRQDKPSSKAGQGQSQPALSTTFDGVAPMLGDPVIAPIPSNESATEDSSSSTQTVASFNRDSPDDQKHSIQHELSDGLPRAHGSSHLRSGRSSTSRRNTNLFPNYSRDDFLWKMLAVGMFSIGFCMTAYSKPEHWEWRQQKPQQSSTKEKGEDDSRRNPFLKKATKRLSFFLKRKDDDDDGGDGNHNNHANSDFRKESQVNEATEDVTTDTVTSSNPESHSPYIMSFGTSSVSTRDASDASAFAMSGIGQLFWAQMPDGTVRVVSAVPPVEHQDSDHNEQPYWDGIYSGAGSISYNTYAPSDDGQETNDERWGQGSDGSRSHRSRSRHSYRPYFAMFGDDVGSYRSGSSRSIGSGSSYSSTGKRPDPTKSTKSVTWSDGESTVFTRSTYTSSSNSTYDSHKVLHRNPFEATRSDLSSRSGTTRSSGSTTRSGSAKTWKSESDLQSVETYTVGTHSVGASVFSGVSDGYGGSTTKSKDHTDAMSTILEESSDHSDSKSEEDGVLSHLESSVLTIPTIGPRQTAGQPDNAGPSGPTITIFETDEPSVLTLPAVFQSRNIHQDIVDQPVPTETGSVEDNPPITEFKATASNKETPSSTMPIDKDAAANDDNRSNSRVATKSAPSHEPERNAHSPLKLSESSGESTTSQSGDKTDPSTRSEDRRIWSAANTEQNIEQLPSSKSQGSQPRVLFTLSDNPKVQLPQPGVSRDQGTQSSLGPRISREQSARSLASHSIQSSASRSVRSGQSARSLPSQSSSSTRGSTFSGASAATSLMSNQSTIKNSLSGIPTGRTFGTWMPELAPQSENSNHQLEDPSSRTERSEEPNVYSLLVDDPSIFSSSTDDMSDIASFYEDDTSFATSIVTTVDSVDPTGEAERSSPLGAIEEETSERSSSSAGRSWRSE